MKQIILLSVVILLTLSACSKDETLSHENPTSLAVSEQKSTSEIVQTGNKKGDKAIDFNVKTIDGKELKLGDYENKPLLLYFFATWCPHCSNDFREIVKAYPEYKDDVEFLAVDLDLKETKEIIERYKNRLGIEDIDFAFGNENILSDYSVRFTTTKYAIGRNGIILWTGSGEVDEKTWRIIFEGLKKS